MNVDEDSVLFSTSFILPSVHKELPNGFIIRPLALTDYDKGFLKTLEKLTVVGNMSKSDFTNHFYCLKSKKDYYTIVIEDLTKQKVIGSGTLIVMHKFIHSNGKVGMIEDIVVDELYRGQNFGKWIIEVLKWIGSNHAGCYKLALDCASKNIPFYEKCGFSQKEFQMTLYLPSNDKSSKL